MSFHHRAVKKFFAHTAVIHISRIEIGESACQELVRHKADLFKVDVLFVVAFHGHMHQPETELLFHKFLLKPRFRAKSS